ncbi:MAG: helix-turn-helix transcriptional regulator [Eggerthellaceae bacterium]|nr:helix-turn-helix transcriptional regulator [Eggerthellaceae bacterium]
MLKDNIKRLRKARGISQQQLADQLHVVRQTISKWERGTSVPDAELLASLATALQTTPNELMGSFAPSPEAAITAPESLALENSLATQNIAYLSKFRHNAKTGITVLAVLAGALAIALVCLGLFTILQTRDLNWLKDGAENGYSLNGTYFYAESPAPDVSIQGASISFAESKSEQCDGFWQLSGHWMGDPVEFHEVSEQPDLYQEWVTDDNPPQSPVVNGGFTRTGDPNVVILKDEEGNEVGWAHLAWTMGNNQEKGLVFVEYQGKSLCLPKRNPDISHQSSDLAAPIAGWGIAAEYSGDITAEDWFSDNDSPTPKDPEE